MASPDTQPIALRIPAILQNPVNRTQKQVEAHNAQQREKVEAKRERIREARAGDGGSGGKNDRRGKRVIRRVDNAAFTSNPHIVRPSRSDYAPPFPLMSHPPLPLRTLPRSSTIPPAELPVKDPFAPSSVNGTFSTSIKGIRQVLRKKGRRTEVVVQKVEDEIRGWLAGRGVLEQEREREHGDCSSTATGESWRMVDGTLLEAEPSAGELQHDGSPTTTTSAPVGQSQSRRIPAQHRPGPTLPRLPIQADGQIPAILELSRSAGHLTWCAVEGFERLVIHLIARYYELVSFSEDHTTDAGEKVRLTHIVQPNIINPRAPVPTGAFATPDNSDLSAPSSSDRSSSASSAGSSTETETETDSDAATEVGLTDDEAEAEVEGYSVIPPSSTTTAPADPLPRAMNNLSLNRTFSNSSSQYAESEGGSEYGMADSLTLPAAAPGGGGSADWLRGFEEDPIDLGAPPGAAAFSPSRARQIQRLSVPAGAAMRKGWQDKPTFFEYLYGA